MTPEGIIEGNKLIAEFLGWEKRGNDMYMFPNLYPSSVDTGHTSFGIEAAQFHTSWDWLMPIVENIQKDLRIMITVNFWSWGTTECKIYPNEVGSTEKEAETETPIEAIWLAVIQFIKYYKENQTA